MKDYKEEMSVLILEEQKEKRKMKKIISIALIAVLALALLAGPLLTAQPPRLKLPQS